MQVRVQVDWRHVVVVVASVAVGLLVWWASPAQSQQAGPEPAARFAFVARADNPVDALAASSVAGQLGAPVYLTSSDSLSEQTRQGLVATAPQVVVLAGGPAALSPTVEQEVAQLLPDAQLRRFAGVDRIETARLVNELTGELGVARPVLAGATVAGDVGIDGALTVAGTDVGAALSALSTRVELLEAGLVAADARSDTLESDLAAANTRADTLESDLAAANTRIGTVESDLAAANTRIGTVESGLAAANTRIGTVESGLAAANTRIGQLEATLAGVSRDGDTLRLSGMNLQLVNGQDATDTRNGLGNLIIGYNAQRLTPATRTGSHYLIVGDLHEWTASGGIVAGLFNTASDDNASVTGGSNNTASGFSASVSGGASNVASGLTASVTGGLANTASGERASVTGGWDNTAGGFATSVTSGSSNTASGETASVTGGSTNTASGSSASVTGGFLNVAGSFSASVAGGREGSASDFYYSRIGNQLFADS